MTQTMRALVYENPHQMPLREIEAPTLQPDEVLVRVAYSGICGSELSGFEGKNQLRKPPLVMGHEFSGTIAAIGQQAALRFPELTCEQPVTVNPLISCGHCDYCQGGQQQLCGQRQLHSASLPGSNAEWITVRADAVYPVPETMPLTTAALTEPAACAVHAARVANPTPDDVALVVGAGPIGLLSIQALRDRGVRTIFCAELNADRMAMARALGAEPITLDEQAVSFATIAVEAVGTAVTRQACLAALRAGGRYISVGLHQQHTELDINDIIRREIILYGVFAYNHLDFAAAVRALADERLGLDMTWNRIEPLERGAACFEELLHSAPTAKIFLQP